jgi:hypothetical protein
MIESGVYKPIPAGSYSQELIQMQRQMLQLEERDRPDIETIIFFIKQLKAKARPDLVEEEKKESEIAKMAQMLHKDF